MISIGDIASAVWASNKSWFCYKNGDGEAVQGVVIGLRGANTQKVVQSVKERLLEIGSMFPCWNKDRYLL